MYLSLILYVSTVISSFTENLQNDHTCHIDSIESAVTIILCIQTNNFTVNPAPPPEQNHIETINHLFTQENQCTFINPSPGVSQQGWDHKQKAYRGENTKQWTYFPGLTKALLLLAIMPFNFSLGFSRNGPSKVSLLLTFASPTAAAALLSFVLAEYGWSLCNSLFVHNVCLCTTCSLAVSKGPAGTAASCSEASRASECCGLDSALTAPEEMCGAELSSAELASVAPASTNWLDEEDRLCVGGLCGKGLVRCMGGFKATSLELFEVVVPIGRTCSNRVHLAKPGTIVMLHFCLNICTAAGYGFSTSFYYIQVSETTIPCGPNKKLLLFARG